MTKKYYGITIEDISDLPPELIKELNISKSVEKEWRIISVINDCGGIAKIDRILVDYYKKYEEIWARQTLNAKLYRMTKRGLIAPDKRQKGLYSTIKTQETKP